MDDTDSTLITFHIDQSAVAVTQAAKSLKT